MRAARALVAGATFVVMAMANGTGSGAPPSTEPPPSEPTTTTTSTTTTVAPTTTTVPATTSTSTVPATTTTITTTSTSTSATTTAPAPSELVTLTATSECHDGVPLGNVVVTAIRDFPGGHIFMEWDTPESSIYDSIRHEQGLPQLGRGESTSVVRQIPSGRPIRVQVSVDLYGGIVAEAELQAPACPLPATAPTMTAEVSACADENGGGIAVTVTNPPGGSESHFEVFVYEAAGFPPEGDASFWSYHRQVSPGDGEQMVVVVDELTFRSPSPDEAGRVQALAAGDYLVQLSWAVPDYGGNLVTDALITVPGCEPSVPTEVRVASFNASLNRAVEGELATDLSTPDDPQAAAVAEIIQRTRPDVLLLNEFDYDADGEAVDSFGTNYLAVAQNGADPIEYPYVFTAPVNTGVASGFDLDNDGTVGGANDAFGFGEFPGQYGMVVLSRFPILDDQVRTFQHLLWASMPDARLPDDPVSPEPGDWYTAEELAVVALSSKSHWDVPIDIDGQIIHILASHPTPPTFDGDEDRNGLRNADEIAFWADYVAGDDTAWIVDDAGITGGLAPDAEFVIVGDLNADPVDGDSLDGAIQQLLDLEVVQEPQPSSDGALEAAEAQGAANTTHGGNAELDTADFADDPAPGNLRTDYVLPSDGLQIVDAGVFWPTTDDPLAALAAGDPPTSSDHRLVWVDLTPTTTPPTTTTPTTTTAATTEVPPATPADYGFDNFFDVPQLGNEAVRGTGCGGDGSIGDVIPDGHWRGYVRSWDGANVEQSSTLQFDLICIYLNPLTDVDQAAYLDGWLVNNNDRTRTVPLAPGFFAHGTTFVGDEVSTPFDQPDVPFDPTQQVWLHIVDGAAVWVVSAPDPT